MTDKPFGPSDLAEASSTSVPTPHATSGAESWPDVYSTPRLEKFGTLTQLTLSGTASGNFETSVLTRKYKPKPKS